MNLEFWKAAGIRALRTFAQALAGSLGSAAMLSDVAWLDCISAAALAALLSILMSIATGLPEAQEKE